MLEIQLKCLESFHNHYVENDKNEKPRLLGIGAFVEHIGKEPTGQILLDEVVSGGEAWYKILAAKGIGSGAKYDKLKEYQEEIRLAWSNLENVFGTRDSERICDIIAQYLWGIDVEDCRGTLLGNLELVIKENKLWKHQASYDIFSKILGFVGQERVDSTQLAQQWGLNRERIRQLKEKLLADFEDDFWFFKMPPFSDKLKSLFLIDNLDVSQLKNTCAKIRDEEDLKLSDTFLIKALSMALNCKLIGNPEQVGSDQLYSSLGNVWKYLYLQSDEEYGRFPIDKVFDRIGLRLYEERTRWEDVELDISEYLDTELSREEIEKYQKIICNDFEDKMILTTNSVILKRNSMYTRPEMVRDALNELDGLAYKDEILDKVSELYPEKEWTEKIVASSINADSHSWFFAVGKSGMFGLCKEGDIRPLIGSGTMNDIIRIYLEKHSEPQHIYPVLVHVNSLFPRRRKLHVIHTFLELDSKGWFEKYEGGFYGLKAKSYSNTQFPKVVGGHSALIKGIVSRNNGIEKQELIDTLVSEQRLLPIQLEYLINLMLKDNRLELKEGCLFQGENFHSEKDVLTLDDVYDEASEGKAELESEEVQEGIETVEEIIQSQPLQKDITRCLVTGCDIPALLDIFPVLPISEGGKNSIENTLVLRKDIRILFEQGLMAIEPESLKLTVSKEISNCDDYLETSGLELFNRLSHLKNEVFNKGLNYRFSLFV